MLQKRNLLSYYFLLSVIKSHFDKIFALTWEIPHHKYIVNTIYRYVNEAGEFGLRIVLN